MFSRAALTTRPFFARASRAVGPSVLRTALPIARPALTASLHWSTRTALYATSKVANEAATPTPGATEKPQNIHDHPRIWEDVDGQTLNHLLSPGSGGPEVDTKVVLLDFFADWCGPCKTLSPLLHSVAKDESMDTTLISLDVDKNPELAQLFQVTAMPTVFGFYNLYPVRRCTFSTPDDRRHVY